jgi:DNA (cytosine-5)-methyltransferase 1
MFSGYGGAEFALKKLGIDFECVGYSEIDKWAIKCYKQNHPNIKNFGDCRNINPEKLPDFDLLTGGFPCQPFSVNTNKNMRGKEHKSYNLFEDILKIVSVKRPGYILLENVKGILGKKSKEVYNKILSSLNEMDYNVKVRLMNSRDYGIPQNRERVYFVGIRNDIYSNFDFPEKENTDLTVNDILENNVERRYPRIMNLKLNKKENIDRFGDLSRYDAILKNKVFKKNSNVMFEILDAPSNIVSRQSDRIYNMKYSPCLTATGKDYIFYKDNSTIVLTPKECFRLMGFLNDEINLDNIIENQKYKLCGNGWDINLVSKIFKEMFKEQSKIT